MCAPLNGQPALREQAGFDFDDNPHNGIRASCKLNVASQSTQITYVRTHRIGACEFQYVAWWNRKTVSLFAYTQCPTPRNQPKNTPLLKNIECYEYTERYGDKPDEEYISVHWNHHQLERFASRNNKRTEVMFFSQAHLTSFDLVKPSNSNLPLTFFTSPEQNSKNRGQACGVLGQDFQRLLYRNLRHLCFDC
jgi:hypothetical protein